MLESWSIYNLDNDYFFLSLSLSETHDQHLLKGC